MKHNIIKTENYLLVVDESEIKEGDFYLRYNNSVLRCTQLKESFNEALNKNEIIILANRCGDPYERSRNYLKKIIAYLPLNNSPVLEGVDLLPRLEDDVKKLAECEYGTDIDSIRGSTHYDLNIDLKRGFARGYNKAKEKYKYTEEDIFEYSNWLFNWCQYNRYRKLIDGVKPYGVGEFISDKDMFDKFLKEKSLQQPKYPVAFECEENIFLATNAFCTDVSLTSDGLKDTILRSPKTTTNSQGITQWVGSYIYE